MGKRPSGGSNASARPAKKTKAEESVLGDMLESEKDTIASISWWDPVMEQLDKMFETHPNLSDWFLAEFPNLEDRVQLANDLGKAFPLPQGEVLSNDFTLVQLVLLEGPKTDASKMPGVEFPVLQPLVPTYFDKEWSTSTIVEGAYECQSLGFVKGWTRGLAFLTAAYLIYNNELVDYYDSSRTSACSKLWCLRTLDQRLTALLQTGIAWFIFSANLSLAPILFLLGRLLKGLQLLVVSC